AVRAPESSVLLVHHARDSHCGVLAESRVVRPLEIARRQVPDPQLELAFGLFELRPSALQRDCAGYGVLSIERALRTAHHLDLIDVEQVEQRHARAGSVDVIDVHTDGSFERPAHAKRPDTAYLQARVLKAMCLFELYD